MKTVVSRCGARVLLALILLAPLGVWTAALSAAGGGQAEHVAARVLPGGEQVVQADRQPLSRVAVDRRGDLGQARFILLGILIGKALPAAAWRWWGRVGRTIQRPHRGDAPVCASRAPPEFRTA
jgi:hypothetical protein